MEDHVIQERTVRRLPKASKLKEMLSSGSRPPILTSPTVSPVYSRVISFQQKHATHLAMKKCKHDKGIKPKQYYLFQFHKYQDFSKASKRKFSH